MSQEEIREFLSTLQEPSVAATLDGRLEVVNDAFRSILRARGWTDVTRLDDVLTDTPEDLDAFLRKVGGTRPAIQGSLTFRDGGQEDRFACYGSLLRRGDSEHEPLVLLRFYRAQDAVRRFQLLGAKIDELNSEIRRRRHVEAELRQVQRTLEQRVAARTSDLERANRELVRSNKALEEFAYVASHDLREPLRKITVFTGILLEEAGSELSEKNRSILTRIVGAAERMDRLIKSLLEYSRISTTSRPFALVDLNRIVSDVLVDLEISVTQTGAEIDVARLPVLRADETQMRQLFQNLISNSLKFRKTDQAPKIVISTSAIREDGESGDVHVIEVSDNGIGFDPHFAEQIFDPFSRLHPRHQFEGTGIGLAVCRRIVERHGGQLSATGVPGQGATFRIVLPVRDPAES